MFLLLLLLSTIKIHITRTLKYFKFKLYPITLKAVFRECREFVLKNVIDLTFKYPQRLCVPYIAWYTVPKCGAVIARAFSVIISAR